MPNRTTFADENVTAVQAMLISMTGTNARVKELTKATLDLAVGLNMDAESAAALVAKSITGSNALSRYGIQIKDAGSQSERTSIIIDKLREKFGGMAEDQAKTATGSVEQMKNMLGELAETVGLLVAQILQQLKPALDWLVPILQGALTVAVNSIKTAFAGVLWVFTKLGAGIEELGNIVGLWNSQYMDQLNRAAEKLVVEYGTNVTNAFKGAAGAAQSYGMEIGHTASSQDQVLARTAQLKKEIEDYTKRQEQAAVGSAMWVQMGGLIADARAELEQLNAALDQSRLTDTERFTKGIEGFLSTFKVVMDLVKQGSGWNIIDPQKMDDDTKQVRDQLEVLDSVRRETFGSEQEFELNELKTQYEKQQEMAHGNEELLTALRNQYAKRRAEIESKYLQKAMQTFADLSMEAIGLLKMAEENRSGAALADIQRRRDAELASIDAQLENENLSEQQREQLRDKRKSLEQQFDNERRQEQARSFAAMKRAAVIESIIQTALAVTKALPNIPLAIAVGALGAAKTALIGAQPTPAFHEGGSFFVNAPPNVQVPILVRGGERGVIQTEKQQADAGTGRGATIHINFNTPVPHSQWVVDSIKKALRDTGLTADKLLVNNRRKTLVTA